MILDRFCFCDGQDRRGTADACGVPHHGLETHATINGHALRGYSTVAAPAVAVVT
jgi:hypothetical protein